MAAGASSTPTRKHAETDGFTLVEIMVVVLIIGVLIAIAMPIFYASIANVRRKTCFANQRTIDAAISTWAASNALSMIALSGVIDASHPLITDKTLKRAPRCPSAPEPADIDNPTAATGAYSLDSSGSLTPCTFGALGAHGSY